MNKKSFLLILFFVLSCFFLPEYLLAEENLPIYFFRGEMIYRINLDGTGEKCISSERTTKFQWSPDGEKICFMTAEGLFLIDNRNNEKLLTSFPQKSKIVNTFEWSPDSKKIVYGIYDKDTNKDGKIDEKDACSLCFLDISRLQKRKIASVTGPPFQIPFYWSKKGENIYFTNFDLSGGKTLIRCYRYSLKKKRNYFMGVEEWPNNNIVKYVGKKKFHFNQNNETTFFETKDVSSDGQTIFTEEGNVYLISKDEQQELGKKIGEFKYFINKFNKGYYNPVWLPDNEHILVVKEVLLRNYIYLVNVKNGEIKKITKGRAANYFHRD